MATGSSKVDTMSRVLTKNVLPKEVLASHCPLDHGRHAIKPTTGLGCLSTLPLEIQQKSLGLLDAQSLITFRCVNQKAMEVVNGMVEWKKVMENATDAIRMLIGSKIAHRVTLARLLEKLYQRNCDFCGKLAPYINVFTMTRQCGEFGKHSRNLPTFSTFMMLESEFDVKSLRFADVSSFLVIPGYYGPTISYKSRVQLYDRDAAFRFLPRAQMRNEWLNDWSNKWRNDRYMLHHRPDLGEEFPLAARLNLVNAPWLSKGSSTVDYPVLCQHCVRANSHQFYVNFARYMPDVELWGRGFHMDRQESLDRILRFKAYSKDTLEKHVAQAHPGT